MMKKLTLTALLVLTALPSQSPTSAGQDDRGNERRALVGLRGVVVIVSIHNTEPALPRFANKEELRTLIEIELRKVGMNIGTAKDLTENPPALIAMVSGIAHSDALITRVELGLYDRVATRRRPADEFGAVIWEKSYSLILTGPGEHERVRNAIRRCVEVFINDWLAANPQR